MVSREKEALAGEKQRAEQKYTQAADIAKQQKVGKTVRQIVFICSQVTFFFPQEDFDASRDKLQKELKHLEIGECDAALRPFPHRYTYFLHCLTCRAFPLTFTFIFSQGFA